MTITGADVPPEQQQIRYELATLSYRLPAVGKARDAIRPWVEHPDAVGRLLGAWETEHGTLGRIYVLRGFADLGELMQERHRARTSAHPFGADGTLTDLRMDSFEPFPFVPPVTPGNYGRVYEIRDYHLVPGGLPATVDGWRQALPGRVEVDPLTVVMAALDGPDRIVHIWPFDGLDERVAIRRRLYAEGIWPPPGGPEHILEAQSIMAWPLDFSPLH